MGCLPITYQIDATHCVRPTACCNVRMCHTYHDNMCPYPGSQLLKQYATRESTLWKGGSQSEIKSVNLVGSSRTTYHTDR